MARDKSSFRIHAEYLAVRAVLGLLARLPVPVAFAIADRIGDLAYLLDGAHRRVAAANLAAVWSTGAAPGPTPSVRRVFRNFVRVAVEFALLPALIERRGVDDVVEVAGLEHLRAAMDAGKGGIIFSAHLGNWESLAAGAAAAGLRYHAVGREMDNPRLDRFLNERRGQYARSVIHKDRALSRVARLLRDGEFVVMLIDQHAGRNGVWVDFLGRPASTFRAPAELAVRFGVPLLGAFGVRVDRSPRFRLEFLPPVWADRAAEREAEVARLTQTMSNVIGDWVMRYPEQWNWLHRRWRTEKRRRALEPGLEVSA